MTLSRVEARHQLFDDGAIGPAVGWYGVATGSSVTVLTDPVKLASSLRGPTFFQGQGRVILPGRAATDRERDAGRVTQAGELTLAGPALGSAVANGESYEFIRRGLSWDRLNAAWAEALRHVYFETTTPVSQLLRDGDLSGLESDAWLASSPDLTFSYSNASEHNDTGFQSLLVSYGGVSDTNTLSQAVGWGVQQGGQFYLAGLVKVLSGTAYWEVLQLGNPTPLRDRVTLTADNQWVHVGGMYSPRSQGTCNLVLGGTHGALVAWDAFPSHYREGLSWKAPGWLDANWKLSRLEEYHYARNLGADLNDARSRQYQSWQPRIDYTPENLAEEANPNRLQVLPPRRSLPAHDLFYRGRRPVSDAYVENETNPTHGNDVMIYAAFAVEVLSMLETRDHLGERGLWLTKQREYQTTVDTQRAARQEAAVAPRSRHNVTVI